MTDYHRERRCDMSFVGMLPVIGTALAILGVIAFLIYAEILDGLED